MRAGVKQHDDAAVDEVEYDRRTVVGNLIMRGSVCLCRILYAAYKLVS
jgi:hypothetical protein